VVRLQAAAGRAAAAAATDAEAAAEQEAVYDAYVKQFMKQVAAIQAHGPKADEADVKPTVTGPGVVAVLTGPGEEPPAKRIKVEAGALHCACACFCIDSFGLQGLQGLAAVCADTELRVSRPTLQSLCPPQATRPSCPPRATALQRAAMRSTGRRRLLRRAQQCRRQHPKRRLLTGRRRSGSQRRVGPV